MEKIKLYAVTLDCPNPQELAQFYANLLHWEVAYSSEDWACVAASGKVQGAYPGITFQKNIDYQPPVWPEKLGAQQQMAHIDFVVEKLEEAVFYAVKCGATIAKEQFSEDWKVLFDPVGHPFCLCQMPTLFESPEFGLL